jgi:hypothetical protein
MAILLPPSVLGPSRLLGPRFSFFFFEVRTIRTSESDQL